MGKCEAKHYKDNTPVIMSRPLVCYGYKKQGCNYEPCKYLSECLAEYKYKMDKKGRRRKQKDKS